VEKVGGEIGLHGFIMDGGLKMDMKKLIKTTKQLQILNDLQRKVQELVNAVTATKGDLRRCIE